MPDKIPEGLSGRVVRLSGIRVPPGTQRLAQEWTELARKILGLYAERGDKRREYYCDIMADTTHRRKAMLIGKSLVNPGFQKMLGRVTPSVIAALRKAGVDIRGKSLYWSVLRAEPGAEEQAVHQDAAGARTYWTIIIPLTLHKGQGTTMFCLGPAGPAKYQVPRGAYCFDGGVWHYGGAQRATQPRLALQAVLTRTADPNREGAAYNCPFVNL